MSAPPPPETTEPVSEGPIALDGLVYGIDLLDALFVLHLGDAQLHASWVRPACGVRAEEIVTTLRDAYRVGQFAARRLAGVAERRADAAPVLTLEMPQRIAVLRRIRAHVVAALFDAAMPLGMARLLAQRLAAALEPELPLADEPVEPPRPRPAVQVLAPAPRVPDVAAFAPAGVRLPKPAGAPEVVASGALRDGLAPRPALRPEEPGPLTGPWAPVPVVHAPDDPADRAPHTLSFGSGLPRRSRPPPPRSPEVERVARLLAYLEAHAPSPHVVRVRLALRAGLTLSALENPEALGPEALVLIETAMQDILGIDRADLRRIA